jgi:hypothetical protein
MPSPCDNGGSLRRCLLDGSAKCFRRSARDSGARFSAVWTAGSSLRPRGAGVSPAAGLVPASLMTSARLLFPFTVFGYGLCCPGLYRLAGQLSIGRGRKCVAAIHGLQVAQAPEATWRESGAADWSRPSGQGRRASANPRPSLRAEDEIGRLRPFSFPQPTTPAGVRVVTTNLSSK